MTDIAGDVTAIGWQFSNAYSIQAGYGLMQAPKGNFKAKVVSLSMAYYFSLPVR